jgi:Integrase core domain
VGRLPHPRRAAYTVFRNRPVDSFKIYASETQAAISKLKTFLRNNAQAIAAIDLCIVPTVTFDVCLHSSLLVMDDDSCYGSPSRGTRRRNGWLDRSPKRSPWASAPAYLVRDNDRAYGQVFKVRVTAMGIRDLPTSPGSPWQNGIAERLIGTLRWECLDHMIVLGERHLHRVLSAYVQYYNQARPHRSLCKDAPLRRAIHQIGNIIAIPILGGLHHQYVRI